MPGASQRQRWALTPPLHNRLIWAYYFSVALSSPSRALGFPKRTAILAARTFLTNSAETKLARQAAGFFKTCLN